MIIAERMPELDPRGDGRIENDASVLQPDAPSSETDTVPAPLVDCLVTSTDNATPRLATVMPRLQAPEEAPIFKRQLVLGAAYAESVGFSQGVAERVARLRPDVLKTHQALTEPAFKPIDLACRGLHDISLAEFRSRLTEPAFVQRVEANYDPKDTWAMYFATKSQARPSAGQLVRGIFIEHEVPAYFFNHARDPNYVMAAVATIAPEDAPDTRPFIRRIGFIGADGAMQFYPYEDLFTPDGQLTSVAKRLDAQMVGPASDPNK